jgi:hypothetical protein
MTSPRLDSTTHDALDPTRRLIFAALFVMAACAAGLLPIWWLGANEDTGFLTLYLLAPVAVAGPLLTVMYLVTGHDVPRFGQRAALFLLIAGNVTLIVCHTWDFILFGGCWDCAWPFTVAKWLLVSTPIVVIGSLIPRKRRPTGGTERAN